MIFYQHFEAEDLLLSRFEGKIELSDIISIIKFIQTSKPARKILYDVRDAELDIEIDDLPVLVSERNKFPKDPDQVSVFLLGKPKETVLGTILIKITENQYNVHICSSAEVAVFILKIKSSKQLLEERLKHLSEKYEG